MKIIVVLGTLVFIVFATSASGAPVNGSLGTENEIPRRSSRVIRASAQCKGVITVRETERRSMPTTDSFIRGRYLKNQQVAIRNVKNGNDQRLWYEVEGTYVEAAYVRITEEDGSGWCKIPAVLPQSTRGPVRRFLSYVFS